MEKVVSFSNSFRECIFTFVIYGAIMVITFGDREPENPSYQPLIKSNLHFWFFRNNLALGQGG